MDPRNIKLKYEMMFIKNKKKILVFEALPVDIDCRLKKDDDNSHVINFTNYITLALKEIWKMFSFDTEKLKNIKSFEWEYYDNDTFKILLKINSLKDLQKLPSYATRFWTLDILIEFEQCDPENTPSINSFYLYVSTMDPKVPQFSILF